MHVMSFFVALLEGGKSTQPLRVGGRCVLREGQTTNRCLRAADQYTYIGCKVYTSVWKAPQNYKQFKWD